MEIGRVNFPEKGPMRGQCKFCIAKRFCKVYFTVINSEDLASVIQFVRYSDPNKN